MVHNVSNNPNYRPSDPPQVGSQQFNNYGSQPQDGQGQSGQYGSGAGQYGSGQAGYSQPRAYGQSGTNNQLAGYSQPNSYNGYVQQGGYSQPVTYGAPPVMVRSASNGMAVWSMWMGIIGVVGELICILLAVLTSILPLIAFIFVVLAMIIGVAPILAVIFGHIGLSQIKRTGQEGRGQGIAGLVIGYVTIGLALVVPLVIVGIFGVSFFAILGAIAGS